jgi:hypothetical protein
MRKKQPIKKDYPVSYPVTYDEKLNLVNETFDFNNWNQRDREVYCKGLKIVYGDKLPENDLEMILNDLGKSKMILFK